MFRVIGLRHDLQRLLVCCFKIDLGCTAVVMGLQEASGAQTPFVTGLEPGVLVDPSVDISRAAFLSEETVDDIVAQTFAVQATLRDTNSIKHQISDHHEDATPPLMEVIEEEGIEWVDPIQGASPLPSTNPQDVPADAPEIAKTYDEVLRVAVPDWWASLR